MLDLAGCWTLSDESGAHVVPFDLPGDGVSALAKAGVIPEPYWGRNEYDCRWVSERDWVARRSFMHDGSAAELVVEGLDTVAEVRLNGVLVMSAANVHRRWRVARIPSGRVRSALSLRALRTCPWRCGADPPSG